jgi:hypothetical protein
MSLPYKDKKIGPQLAQSVSAEGAKSTPPRSYGPNVETIV